jgi:hypothetical protein
MNDPIGDEERISPIPRQPDGNAFLIHCTGGLRSGQIGKDAWKIEPVLHGGKPCARGVFSRPQLQAFIARHGFIGIAFQNLGWTDGSFHSSWTPINPTKANHFLGPADIWRNISSNLTRERTDAHLRGMTKPNREEIAALLDNRTAAERLAQSISLSLRSADISIGQIVDFYQEQLVDLMFSGLLTGQRRSTSLNQTLFAHVHSFFMHIGSARDYLAAFLAASLGKDPEKIDSLVRLKEVLRTENFDASPILQLMRTRGFLTQSAAKAAGWEVSGWLREVSDLRNQFVHKRPYGQMYLEKSGSLRLVDVQLGVYRYFRPIIIGENAHSDLLDVVSGHYRQSVMLFEDAAHASGLDSSILSITDKDIISFELGRNGQPVQKSGTLE